SAPATTESYTLSLHDALPIWSVMKLRVALMKMRATLRMRSAPMLEATLTKRTTFALVVLAASLAFAAVATGGAAQSSQSSSQTRSEEHTSELQSQSNLVCRLL